jgi:hypothetical protein
MEDPAAHAMSEPTEPSQVPDPSSAPPQPARAGGGLWVGALKLALFIGVVLFLHRVVLPRLGIGT